MTRATQTEALTTGQFAKLCGVERWEILAAIRRGFLGEPGRCGPFRVWSRADVDRAKTALIKAGYLTESRNEGAV
jgi:hypothetical protein